MIICVASGKGGTGKTTVATNLVNVIQKDVVLLDCDVEEPNSHIFLKPEITESTEVEIMVPQVDTGKCTLCGECGEICQFSAIVTVGEEVLTFPELCHSCGGCSMVCPVNAISEIGETIGYIEKGNTNKIDFIHGKLKIGSVLAHPLIKKVKKDINKSKTVVIDAPPGTSCPVIEAVKDSDYVILVTEPTPFGLNDLILAVEMLRKLKISFGIVINRSDIGNDEVKKYCNKENIEILVEIPDDRRIAQKYSKGLMITDEIENYDRIFRKLFEQVKNRIDR